MALQGAQDYGPLKQNRYILIQTNERQSKKTHQISFSLFPGDAHFLEAHHSAQLLP